MDSGFDTERRPLLSVTVDARTFARGDDTPVPLDLAVAAVDQTGRQVGFARQTSTVTFPRATSSRPKEAAIQTQLELDPGDYEVRVAISDPAIGVVGSVFSQVVVPPFGSDRLSLSHVTIETVTLDPATASTTPSRSITTTRRVFHHDDRVQARLQVYQGTQRTEAIAPVSVRARVLDAQGRAVRDQSLVLAAKAFTNRRAGCRIAVDVEHLPAGQYLLEFDASLESQTTGRAVRFSVE
jgi:hypothetical protein